jgi:acetyl-CoA acyltransferase
VREAVIVDAARTPIGRRNGGLSGVHPVDLGASVLNGLMDRNDLDPTVVGDVIWGCVTTIGEQSSNVGRWSLLSAGWPESIPAVTVDRACGSSQQAMHFAAAAVASGQSDVVVAGGVESMSRVEMGATRTSGHGLARGPRVAQRYPGADFSQFRGAELIAEKWNLSREQCDEFSLRSHALAAAAADSGRFDAQIVPVTLDDGTVVSRDEGIRRDGSMEKLAKLKPLLSDDGVVTAGSASQISDGAAATLIMSSDKAKELGCAPMARMHSFAVTGVDPVMMLTGPISATARVLERSGLDLADIGAFEVNEAFAPVALAWLAEIGADEKLLNPNGGAIALGHPAGSSGARLASTLIHHMQDNGIRYGLQTMCEAGGMANAVIYELLDGEAA